MSEFQLYATYLPQKKALWALQTFKGNEQTQKKCLAWDWTKHFCFAENFPEWFSCLGKSTDFEKSLKQLSPICMRISGQTLDFYLFFISVFYYKIILSETRRKSDSILLISSVFDWRVYELL